jgi:hypothetical protein
MNRRSSLQSKVQWTDILRSLIPSSTWRKARQIATAATESPQPRPPPSLVRFNFDDSDDPLPSPSEFLQKPLYPEVVKMKELCERNFCGMSLTHFQMHFVRFAFVLSICFYCINVTTITHFLLIYFCGQLAFLWHEVGFHELNTQFITLCLRNTRLNL